MFLQYLQVFFSIICCTLYFGVGLSISYNLIKKKSRVKILYNEESSFLYYFTCSGTQIFLLATICSTFLVKNEGLIGGNYDYMIVHMLINFIHILLNLLVAKKITDTLCLLFKKRNHKKAYLISNIWFLIYSMSSVVGYLTLFLDIIINPGDIKIRDKETNEILDFPLFFMGDRFFISFLLTAFTFFPIFISTICIKLIPEFEKNYISKYAMDIRTRLGPFIVFNIILIVLIYFFDDGHEHSRSLIKAGQNLVSVLNLILLSLFNSETVSKFKLEMLFDPYEPSSEEKHILQMMKNPKELLLSKSEIFKQEFMKWKKLNSHRFVDNSEEYLSKKFIKLVLLSKEHPLRKRLKEIFYKEEINYGMPFEDCFKLYEIRNNTIEKGIFKFVFEYLKRSEMITDSRYHNLNYGYEIENDIQLTEFK